jgi:hypothetical protein
VAWARAYLTTLDHTGRLAAWLPPIPGQRRARPQKV